MNIRKIHEATELTIKGIFTKTLTPEEASAVAAVLKQDIQATRLAFEYAKLRAPDGKITEIPALEYTQQNPETPKATTFEIVAPKPPIEQKDETEHR